MTDVAGHTASPPVIGELARLSASDLLAGYRARHFTPAEVIEEVIDALEQTDARCNVMVTPMFGAARAAARVARRRGSAANRQARSRACR